MMSRMFQRKRQQASVLPPPVGTVSENNPGVRVVASRQRANTAARA